MKLDHILIDTDTIPILDMNGEQLDEVRLPEKITPTPRRRCGCSESHTFYKGSGIVYRGNYTNIIEDHMITISQNSCEYQKYYAVYPKAYQKFGIFTFCHQPVFSDCEGGCGIKERNMLTIQKKFELTAIEEITDIIDVPIGGHNIYAYRLKEVRGSYRDTLRFIEYILSEDFNSAWDKNLWNDIAGYGYLRDLADWFESRELSHKLGTVYALLHSLLKADKYTYEAVVRSTTGLVQLGEVYLPYIAARIVEKYCPDCTRELELDNFSEELYEKLWRLIYMGKSCCHLENNEKWDYIREIFLSQIPARLEILRQEMKSHYIQKIK